MLDAPTTHARRRNPRLLLAALTLAATAMAGMAATGARAETGSRLSFDDGVGPYDVSAAAPFALADDGLIVVEGRVLGRAPVSVLVRVDDADSAPYEDRLNYVATLEPGPFRLALRGSDLIAENGRPLNLDALHRVVVARLSGAESLQIDAISVDAPGLRAAFAEADRLSPTDVALPIVVDTPYSNGVIAMERPAPFALPADAVVRLEGVNDGDADGSVMLRADDAAAPTYADRFNAEFAVRPGPFSIDVDVSRLATPDGRPVDIGWLTRILGAPLSGDGVRLTRLTIASAQDLGRAETPASDVASRAFGTGALPIERSTWFGPVDLDGFDEFTVEGVVSGDAVAGLALRVDDGQSENYATRLNLEWSIPPGPFSFSVPISGMRAPNGRVVDRADVRRIILFATRLGSAVSITRFEARAYPILPNGAAAYAFGADDAAFPPGFEAVGSSDPRVIGRALRVIRRPGPDPLIANGLTGVDLLRLTGPTGRARVTVWTEDPGEWETIPHPLRQRIVANGVTLVDRSESPAEWLDRRYFAGADVEHAADDTPWTAFGRFRGEPVSGVVELTDGRLAIEFFGDEPAARHVAGVLIEPILDETPDAQPARAAVDALRQEWYEQNYRVADPAPAADGAGVSAAIDVASGTVALTDRRGAAIDAVRAVAAPGSGARVAIVATADDAIAEPTPRLAPFAAADGETAPGVGARFWTGRWRLTRTDAASTLLRLTDEMLDADPRGLAVGPDRGRTYEIWIDVADDAPAGLYASSLTIGGVAVPIALEVLPVALPPASASAGFYLTEAQHLLWFGGRAERGPRNRQIACDVAFFTSLGVRGGAPAVPHTPIDNPDILIDDLALAARAGLDGGGLAYNPLYLAALEFGPDASARALADVMRRLEGRGVGAPAWSVADEPLNAAHGAGEAFTRDWIAAIRRAAPTARLAGHANAEEMEPWIDLFDVAVMNAGYGIDLDDLADVARRGVEPWLYNTWRPRASAGLWLWRSDARRYMQWHARMPTALPFDPLDGREDDFFAIYPERAVCADQPTIHRDALAMAEGVADQRWLLWLDEAAERSDAALTLRAEIRDRFAGPFADAARLSQGDLSDLRDELTALARELAR